METKDLTKEFANRFLRFQNEKVIVTQRRHWIVLLSPLFLTAMSSLFFACLSYLLFGVLLDSKLLLLFGLFTVLLITTLVTTKIIVDWYAHLYIVTSHKLMEICYAPLFSHTINEVLLNQVRCTEVDVNIGGAIREFLDMGSVTITFDRPTHQEEFVLANIPHPNITGPALADELEVSPYQTNNLWYHAKGNKKTFKFFEEAVLPTERNLGYAVN